MGQIKQNIALGISLHDTWLGKFDWNAALTDPIKVQVSTCVDEGGLFQTVCFCLWKPHSNAQHWYISTLEKKVCDRDMSLCLSNLNFDFV